MRERAAVRAVLRVAAGAADEVGSGLETGVFTELRLRNFKSFKDAVLPLGPFTVIVGENASGKSNVRDAFRFLMGMARGHTVAETFGRGFTGGELTWGGIRGGLHGACHNGAEEFGVGVDFGSRPAAVEAAYDLDARVPRDLRRPTVAFEQLRNLTSGARYMLRLPPQSDDLADELRHSDFVLTDDGVTFVDPAVEVAVGGSLLPVYGHPRQDRSDDKIPHLRELATRSLVALRGLRCLDADPGAARDPAEPGVPELGELGEGLAAVLRTISEDDGNLGRALASWVAALAPTECQRLLFPIDPNGKVNLQLVESGGRVVNAPSASDGTIRLLVYLAAMFGPRQGKTYIIEELENGIHPTRLHLLVELIERSVEDGDTQVIASTHSPDLLQMLSENSIQHAVLAYRLDGQPDTRLKRIMDIDDADRLIPKYGPADLHSQGWFETTMEFLENAEPGVEQAG
ncbi:MAG: AAA family ATPase [Armatimonadetes bacterium]|nr:AAA family ATPase [Armatimonadota bacterium]